MGADLYGGVCVNVLRHPAWGRAQETYGEDPHHVGEMGAALTRGVQRHAMACVKHFACNSMENARFTVDITVDEVALHEVYLPHFKRIVDEGVAVVMSAYNSVNGEWCGQNRALLTDVLRDRVGIRGLRDQRLDPRPPRRGTVAARRSRRGDALPDDPGRASRWRPRSRRGHLGRGRPGRRAGGGDPAPVRRRPREAGPGPGGAGQTRPTGRWPGRRRPSRWCSCATSRSTGSRCCRWTFGPVGRSPCIGALAGAVNLGDGGSSDVWAPRW